MRNKKPVHQNDSVIYQARISMAKRLADRYDPEAIIPINPKLITEMNKRLKMLKIEDLPDTHM